ncbi:hypothetical protein RHECNPAF_430092 [Rhizobium etli CNPAF512]|nr:hypothetical protein RHECNPAF_430092 [Rhizobium etli CNPAF512]
MIMYWFAKAPFNQFGLWAVSASPGGEEEGSASCITIKWGWFSGSDALTRQWATQILLARGRSLVTASGGVNRHAAAPLQPCRDEVYLVHPDIYIEDARIIARYHAF